MDVQKQLLRTEQSKVRKYQRLIIGDTSFAALVKYELIALLTSWIPGALGLALRSLTYPKLLKQCGRNVTFGRNVVLRHPGKISIGNNVIIDDNCVLDAKGNSNKGINIDDEVFIGRNTIVYCQDGDISIGINTNIGSNCQIFSAKSVRIGADVLIGAYTYLVGGGHSFERIDTPVIEQERVALGIQVGDDIWIGAGVKILDGSVIQNHVIVAAGAVVKDTLPTFAIAGGVPARIIKDRRRDAASNQ
jgi:acetyltransferase-like isoleucine patch superfamily enzyme